MLTNEQQEYLNILAKENTVYEISDMLGIPTAQVYGHFLRNKISYKKKNRKWSYSELEYLKENYGNVQIKNIARTLNRSVMAVINKAARLKLGAFTDNGYDYITFNSLLKMIGVDASYTILFYRYAKETSCTVCKEKITELKRRKENGK